MVQHGVFSLLSDTYIGADMLRYFRATHGQASVCSRLTYLTIPEACPGLRKAGKNDG